MTKLPTGAAFALFCAAAGSPVAAADLLLAHPVWLAAPSASDVSSAHASGGGLLRCEVKPDGQLAACITLTLWSSTADSAARKLVHDFKVAVPTTGAGPKDRLFVDVLIHFDEQGRKGDPIYLVQPIAVRQTAASQQELETAAAKAGVESGVAVIDCDGGRDGSLSSCSVAEEAPSGVALGEHAIAVASGLKLNPWQGGFPVEGQRLRLPIHFFAPSVVDRPGFTRKAIFHVSGGPGTAGPYYPERAYRLGVDGSATIECAASAKGVLSDCIAISESPEDQEFMSAALKMSARGAITVQPTLVDGHPLPVEVVRVEVPFKL